MAQISGREEAARIMALCKKIEELGLHGTSGQAPDLSELPPDEIGEYLYTVALAAGLLGNYAGNGVRYLAARVPVAEAVA